MDQDARLGGFTADHLVRCYQRGVFPMADSRYDDDFYLIEPRQRGVIPLDGFHLSRRLARTVRSDLYRIAIDEDFPGVIAACAESRPGRLDTWINPAIELLYAQLFARGQAHSVETYLDGELAGGLYGVSLGGAFFGESMFSRARDASKVALTHLVARLRVGGYRLLDTQFMTPHLAQFGAEEIPQEMYKARLAAALGERGDFYRLGAGAGGAEALQAITQAS